MNSPPLPDGIDPGKDGAKFLAWLKKRGARQPVWRCRKRCPITGFDPTGFVKSLDTAHIEIPTVNGEKWIVLNNLVWADQWMVYYGEEVPHHRHWHRI